MKNKEILQFNYKVNNPIKNQAIDLNRFVTKIKEWPINTGKDT